MPKNSELMVYIIAQIIADPDSCMAYAVMYPIESVETSNGILFELNRTQRTIAHTHTRRENYNRKLAILSIEQSLNTTLRHSIFLTWLYTVNTNHLGYRCQAHSDTPHIKRVKLGRMWMR